MKNRAILENITNGCC